jgi:hypothetical protein
MISVAWISLPPETLQRMVDEPSSTTPRCRRWERLGATAMATAFAACGLIAAFAVSF